MNQNIMRLVYSLIILLILGFSSNDIAAKKIYLPEVSFEKNTVFESVIKDVIYKCDSVGMYKDEIIEVFIRSSNDTVFCDFSLTELRFIIPSKNLRGYFYIGKHCFIINCEKEEFRRFISLYRASIGRKRSFIIYDPNTIWDTDGDGWLYEIIGNSYRGKRMRY